VALIVVAVVLQAGCAGPEAVQGNKAAERSGTLIGPAGGTIELHDGDRLVSVVVPPDALVGFLFITVERTVDEVPGALGSTYDIGPSGTRFDKPVLVTITSSERGRTPLQPRYRLATRSSDENSNWELLEPAARTPGRSLDGPRT